MSCKLPHRSSLENFQAKLRELGLSDIKLDGEIVADETFVQAADAYRLDLQSRYGRAVPPLYTRFKGSGYAYLNPAAFEFVDDARKRLGIYETRDSGDVVGQDHFDPTPRERASRSYYENIADSVGAQLKVLTSSEFAEMVPLNKSSRAFLKDATIYVKEGAFGEREVFHETAHIIGDAIEAVQPRVYDALVSDALESAEGQKAYRDALAAGSSEEVARSEAFAKTVEVAALRKQRKGTAGRLQTFLNRLADAVRRFLNFDIGDPNVDIESIGKALAEGRRFGDLSRTAMRGQTRFNDAGASTELTPDMANILAHRLATGKSATLEQRRTMQQLSMAKRSVTLAEDGSSYVDKSGKVFTRTSNYLDAFQDKTGQTPFRYDGPDVDSTEATEIGTILDDVFSGALAGKTYVEAVAEASAAQIKRIDEGALEVIINERELTAAFDAAGALQARYPGAILVPQAQLFSKKAKTAGTADVLVIHGDGSIDIIDLKTSKKPTLNPKAALRYRAQVSAYQGMLTEMGFDVSGRMSIVLAVKGGLKKDGKTLHSVEFRTKMPIGLSVYEPVRNAMISERHRANAVTNRIFADGKFADVLERTQMALVDQVEYLRRSRTRRAEADEIRKTAETLDSTDVIGAILELEKNARSILIGGPNKTGAIDIASAVVADHQATEAGDHMELVRRATESKAEIDIFLPLLSDVLAEFHREGGQIEDLDADHPIRGIRAMIDKMAPLSESLADVGARRLARHGMQTINGMADANTELGVNIRALENRISELRKGKDGGIAGTLRKIGAPIPDREKKIAKLQLEISRLRETVIDEDKLYDIFRSNRWDDVSMLDSWLGDMAGSTHPALALFMKEVARVHEEANYETADLAEDIDALTKAYAKESGTSLNAKDELFDFAIDQVEVPTGHDGKMVTTRTDLALVAERDFAKYERDLADLYAKNADGSNVASYKAVKAFLLGKTETVSADPVVEGGVVIHEGLDAFKAKYIERFGQEAWAKFERINTVKQGKTSRLVHRALAIPKKSEYPNAKFDRIAALPESSAEKQLYMKLRESLVKSKERLPIRSVGVSRFILPSVQRSKFERMTEQGVKAYGSQILKENTITRITADPEIAFREGYTERVVRELSPEEASELTEDNPEKVSFDAETGKYYEVAFEAPDSGRRMDVVPTRYTQQMSIEDKSRDLATSVTRFFGESLVYDGRKTLKSMSAVIEEGQVKNPLKRTRDGAISRVADYARVGVDKLQRKDESYFAGQLRHAIQKHVYGRDRDTQTAGGFDLHQVNNLFAKVTTYTTIALDTSVAVANLFGSDAQLLTEANRGRHFNKRDFAWSKKELTKYTAIDVRRDWQTGNPQSKLGKLIRMWEPQAGMGLDMSQRMLGAGVKQKFGNQSILMGMMSASNAMMEAGSTLLMLSAQHKDGSGMRLYDAYELKDGKIALREGYSLEDFGMEGDAAKGMVDTKHKRTMQSVFRKLQGNYSDMTSPSAKRKLLGAAALKYKDFFYQMFQRRMSGIGRVRVNFAEGRREEGYYYTMYKALRDDFRLLQAMVRPYSSMKDLGITELEYQNIRAFAMEAMTVFGSVAATLLLKAAADEADEDGKYWYNLALIHVMRIGTETKTFMDLGEYMRLAKRPFAAQTVVERMGKFAFQLGGDLYDGEFDRYTRQSGFAQKGDTKLMNAAFKILGLKGAWVDPQSVIEGYELARGR